MNPIDYRPGMRLRFDYGPGNTDNRLYHVRAVVDDSYVVVRSWYRERRRWHYSVMHRVYLDQLAQLGRVTPAP